VLFRAPSDAAAYAFPHFGLYGFCCWAWAMIRAVFFSFVAWLEFYYLCYSVGNSIEYVVGVWLLICISSPTTCFFRLRSPKFGLLSLTSSLLTWVWWFGSSCCFVAKWQ
jgi:hypothetical protein